MTLAFFIPSIGPMELCVIIGIGVLMFGKALPSRMRAIGSSLVEFKKGLKEIEEDET